MERDTAATPEDSMAEEAKMAMDLTVVLWSFGNHLFIHLQNDAPKLLVSNNGF